MILKLKSLGAVVLCLGALALPAHAEVAGTGYAGAEHMVVFGDSLSDTGNKHAIRGLVNEAPYDGLNEFGVPSDPYVTEDGIYFANGTIWIDAVGEALGDFGASRPVLGPWPHAGNYAWGGARAVPPPVADGNRHLSQQVSNYLDDVGYQIDPATLHVVFIGGNDMVDALIMLSSGVPFQDVLARLAYTVGTIDQNLQRLIDAGARRFLLLNVPDVGLVPAVQNPGGKAMLTCFTELVNQGETSSCPNVPVTLQIPDSLAAVSDRVAAQGLEVTTVDTFTFIRALAGNPAGFGFTDVSSMCVSPLVAPYECADPNASLFWDGLHPTQATHRLLAAHVINRLGL